jgi:hypothetical protein
MSGVWDLAHSPVLELAAKLGLPLAGLVVITWIIGVAVLVRGVRIQRCHVIVQWRHLRSPYCILR